MKTHNAEELYDMIERRFRSPEWIVLPGVANATGGGMMRRCDALAMNLWPSRGLELHGFEIKVSRSDFLRELADPDKAEKIARYCDRWWLVVSSPEVVKDGELPPTWGLLVARGESLRLKKEAPRLGAVEMSRHFLAALLRTSITSTASARKLEEARREAREAGYQAGQESDAWDKKNLRAEMESANEKLEKITKALGLSASEIAWRPTEQIAAAFQFAMRFGMRQNAGFKHIRKIATEIIAACDKGQGVVDEELDANTERTDA